MIPSLGLLVFVLGLISIYYNFYSNLILTGFSIYLILMLLSSFRRNIITSIVVWLVSIATHFAYGFGWLKGIFSKVDNDEMVGWNSR